MVEFEFKKAHKCPECGIPIQFGCVCVKCAKKARKKKKEEESKKKAAV